ncbi:splicing factor, arginine/serine-rich 15-like [Hyposmocoma kahamanoa]|uniref:splicing factor, arginine/serine-rich 15-like n=1 Tax=Hyposmocoma kahamanoa TaxID=1477025 RepID=UPI000E6D698C|nr:splicing factor, arginine/serine-rich 15-like [Hyposmocoma kahamanoa]
METSNIALLVLVCSVVTVHAYKTDTPDFSNEPLTTLPPITPQQQLYILLLNFVSGNLPPGAQLPAGFLGGMSLSAASVPTMPPNMPMSNMPMPNMLMPIMPMPNMPMANMPPPNMPAVPATATTTAPSMVLPLA